MPQAKLTSIRVFRFIAGVAVSLLVVLGQQEVIGNIIATGMVCQ